MARDDPCVGSGARRGRGKSVAVKKDIVITAVDLGKNAEAVVRAGARLAKGQELCVAHVLPDLRLARSLYPQFTADDATATLELSRAVEEHLATLCEKLGLTDVTLSVEPGTAYSSVAELATRRRAKLLVVGAPSDPSRWLSGTAERIVRYAPCPVLVHRGDGEESGARPVIAATDLSDPSLPAIHAGATLAKDLGAPLHLIHVVDFDRTMSALSFAASIAAASIPTPVPSADLALVAKQSLDAAASIEAPDSTREVLVGSPTTEILDYARRVDAGVIVVGTQGRTGLDRVLVGSVAETIVREAPCSVLVVRQSPLHT
jgi:nucleotide-binding universal stress UspA family protein